MVVIHIDNGITHNTKYQAQFMCGLLVREHVRPDIFRWDWSPLRDPNTIGGRGRLRYFRRFTAEHNPDDRRRAPLPEIKNTPTICWCTECVHKAVYVPALKAMGTDRGSVTPPEWT